MQLSGNLGNFTGSSFKCQVSLLKTGTPALPRETRPNYETSDVSRLHYRVWSPKTFRSEPVVFPQKDMTSV